MNSTLDCLVFLLLTQASLEANTTSTGDEIKVGAPRSKRCCFPLSTSCCPQATIACFDTCKGQCIPLCSTQHCITGCITTCSSICAVPAQVQTQPPLQTLPPITLPPFTLPPATLPPATLPPVTFPPVTFPPVTFPPVTLPPATLSPQPSTQPPQPIIIIMESPSKTHETCMPTCQQSCHSSCPTTICVDVCLKKCENACQACCIPASTASTLPPLILPPAPTTTAAAFPAPIMQCINMCLQPCEMKCRETQPMIICLPLCQQSCKASCTRAQRNVIPCQGGGAGGCTCSSGYNRCAVAPYFPTRRMSSQPKREKIKTKLWWSDEVKHHRATSPIAERKDVVHRLPSSHYETNSMEKPVSKKLIKRPRKSIMRPAFNLDYERDYEQLERKKLEEEERLRRRETSLLQKKESVRLRSLGKQTGMPDQKKKWEFNNTPRKVVRKRPYRKKQVPPRRTNVKVRRASKMGVVSKRRRFQRLRARVVSRRTSRVASKPAWAYVGDPTMRSYRTQERSFRSDFHF
ncbi:hypothetical protein Y032_0015g2735 [Ancylostoma ceylanicum]|uniref:Uncharacterized protein n=2 Tax=Ancylostoma ceylanicum TaxID=53326 RepID=A0A016V7I5_9BILA|nr:hypothetical protein Y032_0015g2735 [Ancylostoma ceylanicum]